jgi:hypothetical protein
LDDQQESVGGGEDEENNYYSIGGMSQRFRRGIRDKKNKL